jgi:hypothetical protein
LAAATRPQEEALQALAREVAELRPEVRELNRIVSTLEQKWNTPPSRPQERLVFLHVPKTGGMALRAFIQGHFDRPNRMIVSDEQKDLHPELLEQSFISGHFGYQTLDKIAPPFVSVIVLREPIARCLSFYSFFRYEGPVADASPADLAEHARLRSLSLEEYAVRGGQNNLAVSMLAGDEGDDAERLTRAKARLRRFDVVGVHEDLWAAAVMLSFRMGWSLPDELPQANITEGGRIHESKVDEHILAELRSRNRLDAELHTFAKELAAERWTRMVRPLVERARGA